MAKCTAPRLIMGLALFFAFAGFASFVAGWALDLGYFNNLATLAASEAQTAVEGGENGDGTDLEQSASTLGTNLGADFLTSMNDHTSAGFTNYIFIITGFVAILMKTLHTCIKNRWFGLLTVFFMSASISVAGFVAGPKGSAFITCMTATENANMTAAEKQLADCVAGENNLNIALQFIGSAVHIISFTFVICMMFFQAQSNLNKIAPAPVSAKQNEVWA